jgi:glycosyltransferase involved in cell wall biosynthesis
MTATRPSILYVVYWGAAEPLGQSLVLPAIANLAASSDLTLVTFEKVADLADKAGVSRIRRFFDDAGVSWMPLRYHKRPKIPATAYDIVHGIAVCIMIALRRKPHIVHGRTFIGGLIAAVSSMFLRCRFVFHNEGFYPDEQVDSGVWRRGSLPHRVARGLERWLYRRADAIVCLSRRSKDVLARDGHERILVTPSCVDLDRFRFRGAAAVQQPLHLVYSGGIGARYSAEKLARFVAMAAKVTGDVRLRIISRSERDLIAAALLRAGVRDDQWTISALPHAEVPGQLARADAGLCFLQQGIADFAGSPTKIGEYWATGIPVVATAGAGDTDEIVRELRVGVILEGDTDSAYRNAVVELHELLKDSDVARRCRLAAETYYALAPFCDQQTALYAELMARSNA